MNALSERTRFLLGTALALLLVLGFVLWAELGSDSLQIMAKEDGPIEWASAFLFGLSSVGFLAVAVRSDFLKQKEKWPRYFMTIAWALLMFVFMGEEISWGQRLFGWGTPDLLSEMNRQQETNIHNLEMLHDVMGGPYRYLSAFMIITGVLLPLAAMTRIGKRAVQRWAFPVAPAGCWLFFVGAYAFGKYYYNRIESSNDAAEIREFLLSVGMFVFAFYGALRPNALFRVSSKGSHDRAA